MSLIKDPSSPPLFMDSKAIYGYNVDDCVNQNYVSLLAEAIEKTVEISLLFGDSVV